MRLRRHDQKRRTSKMLNCPTENFLDGKSGVVALHTERHTERDRETERQTDSWLRQGRSTRSTGGFTMLLESLQTVCRPSYGWLNPIVEFRQTFYNQAYGWIPIAGGISGDLFPNQLGVDSQNCLNFRRIPSQCHVFDVVGSLMCASKPL